MSLPPPIASQVSRCNLPEAPIEETQLTPVKAIGTTPPVHGSPFTRLFSSGTAHTQGLVADPKSISLSTCQGHGWKPVSNHPPLSYARTTSKSSSTRNAKFRLLTLIFAWVASSEASLRIFRILPHRSAINIMNNQVISGILPISTSYTPELCSYPFRSTATLTDTVGDHR